MLNLLTVPLLLVPEGALILNISLVLIVLMAMGMVIPFLNLVILLVINARATRYLRDHGYTVGMFGAKPKA